MTHEPHQTPCGCVHNTLGWLCNCAAHEAETAVIHNLARAEHEDSMRARDPDYLPNPSPNKEAQSC